MALLGRSHFVFFQDLIDDADPRFQLRPPHRL
jgi:hypothetical protein